MMAIATCRNCKWWEAAEEWGGPAKWGDCRMADVVAGVPKYYDTLAKAIDDCSRIATLSTHETFGCVQFLRREGVE